jgi:hypothetical protein
LFILFIYFPCQKPDMIEEQEQRQKVEEFITTIKRMKHPQSKIPWLSPSMKDAFCPVGVKAVPPKRIQALTSTKPNNNKNNNKDISKEKIPTDKIKDDANKTKQNNTQNKDNKRKNVVDNVNNVEIKKKVKKQPES